MIKPHIQSGQHAKTKSIPGLVVCYVALGSNLGKPQVYLKNALKLMGSHPDIHHLKVSGFYSSKPHGPQDQPDYVNAAVRFDTTLAAEMLLDLLQEFESQNDRVGEGSVRWGARTLDLDLLFYGDEVIDSERLVVPHPRICERAFVLLPLHDLDENLKFPDGTTIKGCIASLPADTADEIQRLKLGSMDD